MIIMTPITDSNVKERIRLKNLTEMFDQLSDPKAENCQMYIHIPEYCQGQVKEQIRAENGGVDVLDEQYKYNKARIDSVKSLIKPDKFEKSFPAICVCALVGGVLGAFLAGVIGFIIGAVGIGFVACIFVPLITEGIDKAKVEKMIKGELADNQESFDCNMFEYRKKVWQMTDKTKTDMLILFFGKANDKAVSEIEQYDRDVESAFKKHIKAPYVSDMADKLIDTIDFDTESGKNIEISYEVKMNQLTYSRADMQTRQRSYAFDEKNVGILSSEAECEGLAGAVAKVISSKLKASHKSRINSFKKKHMDANVTIAISLN